MVGDNIGMTADFSSEIMETGRKLNTIFKY